MMRSKWAFLLLIPLLLACEISNIQLPGANSIDLNAENINRQDAIILLGGQPRTLDPALTLGGPAGALGHIFSGLVTLDTDLQVQPDLAGGWDVSDDGRVYTFYLRQNAVFHDGRPVTAEDVVFSWERATDPALGSDTAETYLGDVAGVAEKLAGSAEAISGLRVIDDHTLEVTLDEPVVYFLAKLAYPVAYVVDSNNVTQSDWEHAPNGTGPFRLQRWVDDELMVLARNDLFYDTPALVSHLVYNMGPSLGMTAYETGEIDLVGVGGSSLERAQDPNSELNSQLQTTVDLCTSVIGLNNQLAPFDDVRVRQAFNYALDKERLIDTFSTGNGLVANGPLPPGMPGFGSLDTPTYPYDPEKALELLAEAGYADPAELGTLTYTTSGYGDPGAYVSAVITLWQEALGVTIEPVVLDPFTYFDELYGGNVGHFYGSGWCADYPDPQNFLDILYHSGSAQNIGGFADATIDAQLKAARVEEDPQQRLAQYQQIEQALVEAAPVVFTDHSLSAVLVSPSLVGYELTPMGVRQWHRVGKQ